MKVIALLLSVSLLASCKKDKDDSPSSGFPKEVNIEYRVTTTTSGLNAADVTYTNETGGISTIDMTALPFSKKIKRTVNKYDVIAISTTAAVGGNLKAEILVNDKVVKTETFSGTSIVHGIFTYQF